MRDNAAVQNNESRTVGQRKVKIVRHGNTKPSPLRFLTQQREAVQLLFDIKKCRGLIQQ